MTGPKPLDNGSPPDGALEETMRRDEREPTDPESNPAAKQAAQSAPAAPAPDPLFGPTPPRTPPRPVGPGPLPRFPTDPGGIPVAKGKEANAPEEKVFTRAPTSWTPEKTKAPEHPTGRAAVGEYPTGEAPAKSEAGPTRQQLPWSETGEVKPVPELDEEPDTAVQRPIGDLVDELPTAVRQQARPIPETGVEDLPTAAIPARKSSTSVPVASLDTTASKAYSGPELDEEVVTNTTPVRNPSAQPAIPDSTVRMPPVRERTGPRPTLSAGDEEDAEKKRDRMTALMVLGVGIPLIILVFLATRYEPKPPPERAHIIATPSFSNGGGGGAKHGAGGGGMGKAGGGELPADKRPILALGNDCVSKCAEKQLSCSASCKAGEKCREHCLDRSRTCENSCTGEKATIGDEMLDCLTDTGEPRKCTPADYRKEQAQSKAVMAMCKNNEGEIVPCPDQLAKIEKAKQLMQKQCGPDGKGCAEPGP
ncbi:MAG: hypothetical protein ACJ790_02415 [Myxococcaceae bacterium]